MIAFAAAILFPACNRSEPPPAPPEIVLKPSTIEIRGLTERELGSLRGTEWRLDNWQELVRVTVDDPKAAELPPVLGKYSVAGAALVFTPQYPFEPGRAYQVTFDPARLPRAREAGPVTTVVRVPALDLRPSTLVTAIHPSADVLPENTLRMYIDFSAPMGSDAGREFIRILDQAGKEVAVPFLPVDADFWNPDHTRFTLFFDPGRVKSGILPNQELGRPLRAGGRFTMVVAAGWRDSTGQPLKAEYRKAFRVSAPETHAIMLSAWRVSAPPSGGRDPIVVSFPRPLDHALVSRALGIETRDGLTLDGEVAVDADDTRWRFTPAAPWRAGQYDLVALAILEDPAGNQIGHPFEAEGNASGRGPEEFRLPFTVD